MRLRDILLLNLLSACAMNGGPSPSKSRVVEAGERLKLGRNFASRSPTGA